MKSPQNVSDELAEFFSILEKAKYQSACLTFTTFSLDEFVLFDLLRTYCIPQGLQILVFTDIAKHFNRGVLKDYFPRLRIIHVDVLDSDKKSCSVFHPKMILISLREKFERIAILSANLRNYHLGTSSRTIETFEWFEGSWALKSLPLISSYIEKNDTAKISRLSSKAETYVMTVNRERRITHLDSQRRTIDEIIFEKIVPQLKLDSLAGAPFIALAVAKKINKLGVARFWRTAKSRPLHAKFLQIGESRFWGSFNLTAQAFFGNKNKTPKNFEVIVIETKPFDFSTSRKQLGALGASVDISQLDNDSMPADLSDDQSPENWRELKEWHRQAPLEISLELLSMSSRKKKRVLQLKPNPNWKGATKIRLSSQYGEALELRCKGLRTSIPVEEVDKAAFVEILTGGKKSLKALASPKVEGFKGREKIWESYLSIGLITSISLDSRKHSNLKIKSSSSSAMNTAVSFVDIRTVRNRILVDDVSIDGLEILKELFGEEFDLSWLRTLQEFIRG